jgi:hypothetical protein
VQHGKAFMPECRHAFIRHNFMIMVNGIKA